METGGPILLNELELSSILTGVQDLTVHFEATAGMSCKTQSIRHLYTNYNTLTMFYKDGPEASLPEPYKKD